MPDNEMESGFELELDNRKLLVAFVILIVIIGCFFVWGYMVGKRQGMQLAAVSGTDSAAAFLADEPFSPGTKTDDTVATDSYAKPDEVQQNLDWYQSVNKKSEDSVPSQPARKSASKSSAAAAAIYSVQVGAFNKAQDAEAYARDIRSKGFESRVVPPESSGRFYLVKVGRFNTRAEAVAMQLRLKNSGFNSFVKTE